MGVIIKRQHSIIKKLQLIIEVFKGKITIDDILDDIKEIFADPDYSCHYNYLVDLRRSNILFSEDDFKKIFETLKNGPQGYSHHKTALLTSTPDQTATSILIISGEMPRGFKDMVFTSMSGAMKYLEINHKHRDLIISEIDKMTGEKH